MQTKKETNDQPSFSPSEETQRASEDTFTAESADDLLRQLGPLAPVAQELMRRMAAEPPETRRADPRTDALIDNLVGMCAFGGPCGQTSRSRGEYCTACEAAARLTEVASLQATLAEQDSKQQGYQVAIRNLEQALEERTRELKEWKTLAGVGTWHADCRPNRLMAAETIAKQQATIDKLADTITSLSARAEAAEATLTAAQEALRAIVAHQVPDGASSLPAAQEWALGVWNIAVAALTASPAKATDGNGACGRCGHLSSEHGIGDENWQGCYRCECISFVIPKLTASPAAQKEPSDPDGDFQPSPDDERHEA